MPSDQSTWFIAVPQDDDSENLLQEVSSSLSQISGSKSSLGVASLSVPEFKVSRNGFPDYRVLKDFIDRDT